MDRFIVSTFALVLCSASVVHAHGSEGRGRGSCHRSPKIAVVGAGATGLSVAYALRKRGYTRVTLFEKESEIGGFARTRWVDGKAFDLATMFVPGSTLAGHGVEPLLDEMIEVSGEPLVPAVDFDPLLVTEQGNVYRELPLPLVAACSTPESVPWCKEQLIRGFALQTQFLHCLSQGIGPVACGISDPDFPNENVVEWGARHNVELFVQLTLYTADGLGAAGNLANGVPNINSLIPMAHWNPAEVYRSLRLLGTTAEEVPDELPNLRSMFDADSQRWYFFENGYQTFFQSLVREADLRVKLNAEVCSLRYNARKQQWRVVYRNGPWKRPKVRHFDQVIVTTPPGVAASLLSDQAPQAELLLDAVAGGYPVRVFLAPMEGEPEVVTQNLPNPYAYWVKDPTIEASPSFVPAVRPFFWQKRHADSNYVVVGSYNYGEASLADTFEAARAYADEVFGVTLEPLEASLSATFPSRPRDVTAWRQGWAELQGRDGLYFSGEAFFGGGVPGITAGVNRLVEAHFEDLTAGH